MGRLGRGWGGPKSPNFPPKIGLLRGSLAILRGVLAYPSWDFEIAKVKVEEAIAILGGNFGFVVGPLFLSWKGTLLSFLNHRTPP